jgi:hypothetical protein
MHLPDHGKRRSVGRVCGRVENGAIGRDHITHGDRGAIIETGIAYERESVSPGRWPLPCCEIRLWPATLVEADKPLVKQVIDTFRGSIRCLPGIKIEWQLLDTETDTRRLLLIAP